MLQFRSKVDRQSRGFCFEKLVPRAEANNTAEYSGGGRGKRNVQDPIDRAMFYCWADKLGTQRDERGQPCTEGNYAPCWTDSEIEYAVKGK